MTEMDSNSNRNEAGRASPWEALLHPITFIALLMILGVYVLIGSAIFGFDHGVLASMSKFEFARGLITYLFAIVTIGTAVVLVVSALTTQSSEETEKRFQKGKEVFSLLLGIFGTVMGFYFASEIRGGSPEGKGLQLSVPLLSVEKAAGGQEFAVSAYVSGGAPPYKFGVAIGANGDVKFEQNAREDGWIVTRALAPPVTSQSNLEVKLAVRDSSGRVAATSARVQVVPN